MGAPGTQTNLSLAVSTIATACFSAATYALVANCLPYLNPLTATVHMTAVSVLYLLSAYFENSFAKSLFLTCSSLTHVHYTASAAISAGTVTASGITVVFGLSTAWFLGGMSLAMFVAYVVNEQFKKCWCC